MSLGQLLVRLAIPLTAGASLTALSSVQGDAAAAAESGFLALLSTAVLIPAAVLSLRTEPPALLAALLVVAGWALPPGPTRGGVVVLLLTLALAWGLLARIGSEREALGRAGIVAAALGLQLLGRSRLLHEAALDPETLLQLFGLPLAGAVAIAYLGASDGNRNVLMGAAAALALAPAWTVSSTLALLTLAGASVVRRHSLAAPIRLAVPVLPAAAALALDPSLSMVLLILGMAATFERGPLLVVAALTALGAALLAGQVSWLQALAGLAWLPLLLPTAFLPGGVPPARLLAAAAVALASLRLLPPPAALAGPLIWIALVLGERPTRTGLQAVWSGGLLTGTVLLASYPWFRGRPLEAALRGVALEPGWVSAALVVVLVGAATWLVERAQRAGIGLRPAAAGIGLAALGAVAALPAPSSPLLQGAATVLDADRPHWRWETPEPAPTSELVIDSYLANAAELPEGAVVATLRLETSRGGQELLLRAGSETGEWAARRADVASRSGFRAPEPWLSWAAPGGFFGQRYRARERLRIPAEVRRLTLERRPDLPPDVALVVSQVELRR